MRRDRLHPPETAFRVDSHGLVRVTPAVEDEPLTGRAATNWRRPRGAAAARSDPPPQPDRLAAPLPAREKRRDAVRRWCSPATPTPGRSGSPAFRS